MGNFFPDQRYRSDGEPELGVGILTETSKAGRLMALIKYLIKLVYGKFFS